MVRIRLRRVGRKKQPSYRLVAADKESPRDGRFIENLGFYNPRTEPATINLKEDRIFDWLSKGAQPSDAAYKVMRAAGAWERYERFKAGEELDKLLEEAAAAESARNVSSKTRRDAPVARKKAEPEAAEQPEAEAKAEEEVEVEEPQVEEPAQEEEAAPEAKAEVEEPKAEVEEADAEADEEQAEEETPVEAEQAVEVEEEAESEEESKS